MAGLHRGEPPSEADHRCFMSSFKYFIAINSLSAASQLIFKI